MAEGKRQLLRHCLGTGWYIVLKSSQDTLIVLRCWRTAQLAWVAAFVLVVLLGCSLKHPLCKLALLAGLLAQIL